MTKKINESRINQYKDAIQKAKNFFKKIYDNEKISHLNVEEFEIDDSMNKFIITLGWDEPNPMTQAEGTFKSFLEPKAIRKYKTFIVDSTNGEVEKMKIWRTYDDE
ncbi:MAG: hypothetical protein LBM96_11850 [Methanobrevibacter sp.]|jgi:hypothetical protein|nr:hypothetical protein [Candidatus Methanoflexus mossambicus]